MTYAADREILLSLRIRCAVCGTLITKLSIEQPPDFRGWVINAYCHGDEDRMMISELFICDVGQDGLGEMLKSEGTAFTTKRIEG